MFSMHNINSNTISIRNLILLFLTIVLGFASVITLANIDILSDIENARQTIAKITVTADGTNVWELEMEVSSAGIYINTGILHEQVGFSWRVLGIDDNGNLVYAFSENLVVAWWGGGGHRTGNGTDIRNINPGNVGIGTPAMSGKLHIKWAGTTDVYIEETNAGNAANINLRNTTNTWMIWGYSDRFYLGLNGTAFLNIISSWYVGIGTTWPKAPLQVIGNFIAGEYSNTISGTNSSIGWWSGNIITGHKSVIWWGEDNQIISDKSAILWWKSNKIKEKSASSSIVGWENNEIISSLNSFIGWGNINHITLSARSVIGWWNTNNITDNSRYSVIPWWWYNNISNADYSFAAGVKAYNTWWYDRTFVRNSDDSNNFYAWKTGSFLINVPFVKWDWDTTAEGWIGINTNNPLWELHIGGGGVIVFQPQTINPQWSGAGCSVLGSVVFNQNAKKLCYCDGTKRYTIGGDILCSF